ncbi:hypothetical protein TWF694_005945 [Orbilia ellipsospora]|uniref:Uncharacterized protein n=1 Tax=Orbilia ellipsospora TaxID=2528407 RepID=A0AAV9WTM8_9PEZI
MANPNQTDEERRMIEQMKADLGDHRITALPLGDRFPGRRGPPPPPRAGRFEGPGDARVIFGPRPGGPPHVAHENPNPGPQKIPGERKREADPRWAALYDDSAGIERDGLGEGDLHRQGASYHPRRRRSFSGIETERAFTFKKENMLKERPVFPNGSGPGPSNFRNKQDPPPFVLGNRPTDKRAGGKPFQVRALGQVPQVRLPRGSPGTNQKGGPWRAAGPLVVDQDVFFKHMVEKTGLTSKPFTASVAKSTSNSNVEKPVAKPMSSAKDMAPENLSAEVEKFQQAAQSKFPTGFIPPHLRHTVKAETPKIAVQDAPAPSIPVEKSEKVLEIAVLPLTPNESPDTILTAAVPPEIVPPENFALEAVPGTPTSSVCTASPSNSEKAIIFSQKFFELVARPHWKHLLEEYDNVPQQISFLSTYYFLHPKEWSEIEKNGPPAVEALINLTRNFMAEDREKEKEVLKAKTLLVEESVETVAQMPPEDKTWWHVDISEEAIEEWAEKVQESHRNSLLKALKQRIKEEKDFEQAQKLYGKIKVLLRIHKKIATTVSPLAQGPAKNFDDMLDEITLEPDVEKAGPQGVPSIHEMDPGSWKPKRTGSLEKFLREFPSKGEKMSTVSDETPARKSSGTPADEYTSIESTTNFEAYGRLSRLTTPAPPVLKARETSAERREREKRERMAEIERTFALKKVTEQGKLKGTEEHQEALEGTDIKEAVSRPYKVKYPPHQIDIAVDYPTLIAMAEPPKIEIEDSTFEGDDGAYKDVADAIAYLQEVREGGIRPEQIELIRAQNRKLLPKLIEERPWHLNIGLPRIVPGAEPISIRMECTNTLPTDLVLELRKALGGSEWSSASKHPHFRTTVSEVTQVFYSKMAKKWGPTFAYGV